ncbi:hypothetical protein ZHAS_00017951 [Anopheles sinensis]|uniref:Uncharacterized protein n=1 Tax=Anopheles sinensis TaxID=74873 RepID=A0A084WI75_ANOSI|nr:hypothetical protein ZHAS_00017951 [Anopheles sinensis]
MCDSGEVQASPASASNGIVEAINPAVQLASSLSTHSMHQQLQLQQQQPMAPEGQQQPGEGGVRVGAGTGAGKPVAAGKTEGGDGRPGSVAVRGGQPAPRARHGRTETTSGTQVTTDSAVLCVPVFRTEPFPVP